jgi:hypothetical protein
VALHWIVREEITFPHPVIRYREPRTSPAGALIVKDLKIIEFGMVRARLNKRGDAMSDFYSPYAHILLYSCRGCNKPLSIVVMSPERNLEQLDAGTFDIRCECGWEKQLLGVEGVCHWVTEWETKDTVESRADIRRNS